MIDWIRARTGLLFTERGGCQVDWERVSRSRDETSKMSSRFCVVEIEIESWKEVDTGESEVKRKIEKGYREDRKENKKRKQEKNT